MLDDHIKKINKSNQNVEFKGSHRQMLCLMACFTVHTGD